MPQIAQLAETYASQIFWLLLTFGIVYLVIGRGMLGKVQSTVDARDKAVSDDLAAAEAARKSADEAEERWRQQEAAAREQAQAVIARARSAAATATEGKLAAANEALGARINAAEAGIAAATEAAKDEIESVAVEAAQAIVQQFSGTKVTVTDARKAVKAAING